MRLKSDFVVSAALRKANRFAISAFVLKKGDPDAGAIFMELEIDRDAVQLFHRRFDFEENEVWECLNEGLSKPAHVVSGQIEREIARDPDCWVIFVQDKHARNIFTITSE